MILASLRELALREGLVEDPSFESKPVRWVIGLGPEGRFRQAYDTNESQALPQGSKKKPKMEARPMAIPWRCVRASGIKANFLVDTAKYVLGEGAEAGESDPKKRGPIGCFSQVVGGGTGCGSYTGVAGSAGISR